MKKKHLTTSLSVLISSQYLISAHKLPKMQRLHGKTQWQPIIAMLQ